jgi:hypothetical protein
MATNGISYSDRVGNGDDVRVGNGSNGDGGNTTTGNDE